MGGSTVPASGGVFLLVQHASISRPFLFFARTKTCGTIEVEAGGVFSCYPTLISGPSLNRPLPRQQRASSAETIWRPGLPPAWRTTRQVRVRCEALMRSTTWPRPGALFFN